MQINLKMADSIQKEKDQPFCTFFLFINSGSGGGVGTGIINQEIQKIEFQIPIDNAKDIRKIDSYFINMRKNRDFGFKHLRELNSKNKKTYGIVCGGDGTVMWVVGQFLKYDIDPMKTPIGVIPLGTGNDFSRALGWGAVKTMLLQYHYRSLKKLVRKWIHAIEEDFDLWDVTAQVFQHGKFQKVQNGQNKLVQGKSFTKTFCNYFSFGMDGKVGYSFDMHRADSRIGNLAVYGGLGLVKSMTKTKTVDELVQSFHIIRRANSEKQKGLQDSQLIFTSKSKKMSNGPNRLSKMQQQKQLDQGQYITPGLVNILALNINSYTGGTEDIWDKAKQIFKKNIDKRVPQSFSDGQLQLVSFGSSVGIAMQKPFGGFANRIAQDKGPFVFTFHKYPQTVKHRTYLQIDGEFIRYTHPKKIIIQQSNIVKNGKIRVIRRDLNYVPYIPQNQKQK